MTTIETGDLHANHGAVTVGVAQGGGGITVNNIQNIAVSPETAAALALPSPRTLSPDQAQDVAARLLDSIASYHLYLALRGMGSDGAARRFPLVEVFVPLGARLIRPEADTFSHELRVAGRPLAADERAGLGGRPDAPRPVLDLVRDYPLLVVLGDPGPGKSTLLVYLAFVLATGQAAALGLTERLPLLVPLTPMPRPWSASRI